MRRQAAQALLRPSVWSSHQRCLIGAEPPRRFPGPSATYITSQRPPSSEASSSSSTVPAKAAEASSSAAGGNSRTAKQRWSILSRPKTTGEKTTKALVASRRFKSELTSINRQPNFCLNCQPFLVCFCGWSIFAIFEPSGNRIVRLTRCSTDSGTGWLPQVQI